MKAITKLNREKPEMQGYARNYLDCLSDMLKELDLSDIESFMKAILNARERDARIFFIGNGGSAATATHFANDVAISSRSWAKPFRAVSLTDNISILSSIANDYGYEDIFVRQLKTQMVPGDVVVAISVSGNSPNVLSAVSYANDNGAITVALTGFDGGKLRQLAHIAVHVPTEIGDYGHSEDVHMILNHLVGAFLRSVSSLENGANKQGGALI